MMILHYNMKIPKQMRKAPCFREKYPISKIYLSPKTILKISHPKRTRITKFRIRLSWFDFDLVIVFKKTE